MRPAGEIRKALLAAAASQATAERGLTVRELAKAACFELAEVLVAVDNLRRGGHVVVLVPAGWSTAKSRLLSMRCPHKGLLWLRMTRCVVCRQRCAAGGKGWFACTLLALRTLAWWLTWAQGVLYDAAPRALASD